MTAKARLVLAAALLLASAPCAGADYLVKPGDNLSKIAKSELGDASRWVEIARLNSIDPPYRLRVGQRLRLPDAPRSASAPPPGPPPEGEAALELPGQAWLWLGAALAAAWVAGALCLRIGCWFSLVEASLGRCAWLALLLAVLLVLSLAGAAGLAHLAFGGSAPEGLVAAGGVGLLVAYLALSVVVTKRVLGCRWRSVVTVFVMAEFAAHSVVAALMLALFLLLPAAMGTKEAWDLIRALFQPT
jgi:hypothetical protein